MAQYDHETVVVYQAYRPSIAEFAVKHQYFGGDFSYTRMSWIKPNFLWMMYRSGWASKPGQEHILALHLKRDFFNQLLAAAYPSSCPEDMAYNEWKQNIATTDVRLQWDPDHDPYGHKETRRAIQLGLRNQFLKPFQGDAILKIEDITDFVKAQHQILLSSGIQDLNMPKETVYPVAETVKAILGLSM